MAQSMTGYGRAEAVLDNGKLTIEFRTLNGKNADINIKTSLIPKDKEIAIRKRIAEKLQRGTIDMFITWEANAAESAKKINKELALEYYRDITELAKQIGAVNLTDNNPNMLLANILRMPEIIDNKKAEVVTEENWPIIDKAIDQALNNLIDFRSKEGEILVADVTAKVEKILAGSHEIEKYEAERAQAVRERILAKFEELSIAADKDRLEQEMIYYLEKLDINEERVRLRRHCEYYLEVLNSDPYPGKKLGFIAQEMGREINTTGSKANHQEIQKIVTIMKDELEKIKEQSLNIL